MKTDKFRCLPDLEDGCPPDLLDGCLTELEDGCVPDLKDGRLSDLEDGWNFDVSLCSLRCYQTLPNKSSRFSRSKFKQFSCYISDPYQSFLDESRKSRGLNSGSNLLLVF